jgi:hypothetical protein
LRTEAGALAMSAAPARVPESQNAAPLYEEAFAAMGDLSQWPEDYIRISNNSQSAETFDPHDPKLALFLKGQEQSMVLLRRAAAMPGCYFEHDYSRPRFDMVMLDAARTSQWMGAWTLFSLSARVKATAGQSDAALAEVETMLRMARHREAEPFLLWLLLGASMEGRAADTLEYVLAHTHPTAARLAAFDVAPSRVYRSLLPRALRMEEAAAESMVSMLAGGDLALPYPAGERENRNYQDHMSFFRATRAPYRVFLLADDLAAYRAGMRWYQTLLEKPYRETHEAWRDPRQFGPASMGGIMARMLLPAFSLTAEAATAADARRDLMRVAVAAARYREEKGELPKSLNDLVPQYLLSVPLDPFDGEPLRMVLKDGAAVFYSIGKDFKDDGGAPMDEHKRKGDITFRLGPLPK